jgi:hypothetical protein
MQKESRSISENVTWGHRKRFSDAKVSMPYKRFLGYEKGDDGIPKIVESEAEIVRRIYCLFMEGKITSAIAKYLAESDIPSPSGKTMAGSHGRFHIDQRKKARAMHYCRNASRLIFRVKNESQRCRNLKVLRGVQPSGYN